MRAQTAATPSSEAASNSKKKFGKNLSKLVKPAAPPIVDRSLGSSRNGLLLLSKNKSGVASGSSSSSSHTNNIASSGGLLSKSTTASSSNAAIASTALTTATTATTTNATTASVSKNAAASKSTGTTTTTSSSYDALLSAVKGEIPATNAPPPDAWGVASTATTETATTSAVKEVSSGNGTSESDLGNNSVTTSAVSVKGGGGGVVIENATTTNTCSSGNARKDHPSSSSTSSSSFDAAPELIGDATGTTNSVVVATCPNWDEYGGRGDMRSSGSSQNNINNSRGHRGLVLVEVGGAVGTSTAADDEESQTLIMSRLARERAEKKRQEENARLAHQQQKAAMRLRELDEKKVVIVTNNNATTDTAPPPPSRRGWDMSKRELWEPPGQQHQQQNSKQQPQVRTRSDSAGDRSGSEGGNVAPQSPTGGGGGSPHMTPAMSSSTGGYNGPLIHLSSYEDRDRGEQRNTSSAPRMLFDPKSGSMVAVKSREDVAASATTAAAAASNKKKNNKKTRNIKDATTTTNNRDSPTDVTKIARNKSKKEIGNSPTIVVTNESSPAATSANAAAATAIKAPKWSRKFPRTCGVLYKRDDKGNCYCADECDGDLGYGAHSVPGGRAKNPEAYSVFVKQHQQLYNKTGTVNYDGGGHLRFDMFEDGNYDGDGGDVALYTGFNPAEEELLPEPIEYVRADDKLELVTGVDDSPSLKPTAKEWAPSQAALAAARAAAERPRSNVDSSDEEDDYAEDEDDIGPLGLGFDPTLDMDFVMQSPSHDDDAKHLDSFAISALTLEPPAYSATETSGPRHIFAFGTSGTWGVTHPSSTSSSTDWKVADISDVAGLFGAGAFRVTDDDAKASTTAASFLNIPSSSSWGSPTLGGLTKGEAPTTTTAAGD